MKSKVFDKNLSKYDDHVAPVIHIASYLKNLLTGEQLKKLEEACLKEYQASKQALNESIGDVATQDENALKFASELSKRVLTIIDIAADLGLDARISTEQTEESQLTKIGVQAEAITARAPGFLNELRKGTLKSKIISDGGEHEAGYTGLSPLAIQNSVNGNLRERMYIPYKSTWNFTNSLLANPEHVKQINEQLKLRNYTWQVNAESISELQKKLGNKPLYTYGAYASSREGSRVNYDEEHRSEYRKQNPTVKEIQNKRMPLSEREILAQTGDLDRNSDKRVKWTPGEAWSGVLSDHSAHPSLKAADETGDVMLTGISGTTDSMLTLGEFLGMFDGSDKEERMRDAMVACMGWMIDARDHTAHEIQTSAKSFGLDYTPGPNSYTQIRPNDSEFEGALIKAQEKRGYEMPDKVIDEAHVTQKAKELFPNLAQKQMQSMKESLKDLRKSIETAEPTEQNQEETSSNLKNK